MDNPGPRRIPETCGPTASDTTGRWSSPRSRRTAGPCRPIREAGYPCATLANQPATSRPSTAQPPTSTVVLPGLRGSAASASAHRDRGERGVEMANVVDLRAPLGRRTHAGHGGGRLDPHPAVPAVRRPMSPEQPPAVTMPALFGNGLGHGQFPVSCFGVPGNQRVQRPIHSAGTDAGTCGGHLQIGVGSGHIARSSRGFQKGRNSSIFGQRSITTFSPASSASLAARSS
jgi:hypothetical protein